MTPQEIRERRLALGLTPRELAARVGVTPGAVRQWERGTRAPYPATLRRLEAAFAGTSDCGGQDGGCICRCHRVVREPWSAEELDDLRAAVGRYEEPAVIAAALTAKYGRPRTPNAVARRAQALGFSFRDGWYSENDVRIRLRVSAPVVRRWRTDGLLRAVRHIGAARNRPSVWWRIAAEDLEAFIDQYAGIEFDPSGVRDPVLRERAEAASHARRAAS